MKIIKVKRLIYSKLGCNEVIYGGVEYDGNLSDENILGSVHELGKTKWLPTAWVGPGDKYEDELWLLKPDPNHPEIKYPVYRILVDTFYRYEKTWWDTLWDWIRRVI